MSPCPHVPSILRHLDYWMLDFKSQGCGSIQQGQDFGGIEQQSVMEKRSPWMQATFLASRGSLALPNGLLPHNHHPYYNGSQIRRKI
ncbi:hypothetical protein WN944_000583 [Citrus x changshan-huyou]|uniref:Uncharacterized protein n=1 Tax=Citrus x changshan-huyou TaxID=2935761 RepID=A0AAP0MD58_9ROSI